MTGLGKKGITVLKIVVSIALIYFVFTKLNFNEVANTLKQARPTYLLSALLLLLLSKIFAAFRLNSYFHHLALPLTHASNMKLYLLGMFYNLFLPGGIGGDAFKGYLIKKKFELGTKRVVSVLVLDRLSGLLLIIILSCVLAITVQLDQIQPYRPIFGIIIPTAIFTYWLLNKKFFNYVLPVFWKTIAYSTLVQLVQLACVLMLLKSLSIEIFTLEYLLIFLISSIVSVLPITIGGIGSREVVFLYGATLLGLNQNTSVGISMLFFLLTALISLCGLIYHFKKPELETYKA